MRNILVKLIGVATLFAVCTVSAETVEVGSISQPLSWQGLESKFTSSDSVDNGCTPDAGGVAGIGLYNCIEVSSAPDSKSTLSSIALYANNAFASYNQTTKHFTKFAFGDLGVVGKTIPAIVSGVIQSTGTIANNAISAEGWVAFGVKVEIYRSATDNIENALLIGGTSAISEGCASTLPNTLEFPEPCRNVFSNDVPVSIPLLITEGYQYFVVVTASCDAQGPGASCYGTSFFESIFEAEGINTLATDFVVSVADEGVDVPVSSRASQESIDLLLTNIKTLQASVNANKALAEANQITNQSNFDELNRLIKLPLGKRMQGN